MPKTQYLCVSFSKMAFNHISPKTIKFFTLIIFFLYIHGSSLTNAFSLQFNNESLKAASTDYGNLVHEIPSAVLDPTSVNDIVDLIKSSYNRPTPFTIAAKGRGHSVGGQAMTRKGVVVNMTYLYQPGKGITVAGDRNSGFYADVGGGHLWIDVLKETLKSGLAPVSWVDYLYMSVGGVLSNAGISGQSYSRGPQISNVLELDVITGKGELITCSRNTNSDLFYGVLGGLGQFGIMTRVRIVLEKAPARVKWARLLYNNFTDLLRDQELLTSISAVNYLEGFIITNENFVKEWRSYMTSSSSDSDVASLLKKQGVIYSIELGMYYEDNASNTIEEELNALLKKLNFSPKCDFRADVALFDFLDRLGNIDNDPKGQLECHPWLNLYIPKSRIMDFYAEVFVNMFPKLNEPNGVFLFYPLNRKTWDDRMSAVIPDEDNFYKLALLHTAPIGKPQTIQEFNNQILGFCEKNGIEVKIYMPEFKSREDWIKHFGSKWNIFQQRKMQYDPKMILSPGQGIFNPKI